MAAVLVVQAVLVVEGELEVIAVQEVVEGPRAVGLLGVVEAVEAAVLPQGMVAAGGLVQAAAA